MIIYIKSQEGWKYIKRSVIFLAIYISIILFVILIGLAFNYLNIFGGIIGIIAISIVFWDHFKDDLRFTKRVQEFYEDIENYVYNFYLLNIYLLLYYADPNRSDEFRRTFHDTQRSRNTYLGFISQKFDEYSKYLGIIRIGGGDVINKTNVRIVLDKEVTNYVLCKIDTEYADLYYVMKKIKKKPVVNNVWSIKDSEIDLINQYFKGLREYWKNNYSNRLFRPKLKSKVEFNSLKTQKRRG